MGEIVEFKQSETQSETFTLVCACKNDQFWVKWDAEDGVGFVCTQCGAYRPIEQVT